MRNGLSLRISRQIRWSKGPHLETPCSTLPNLDPVRAERVARLATKYGVKFESSFGVRTTLDNYAYLEFLDCAFGAHALHPLDLAITDVGSGSFWYAAATHAFFRPSQLDGFEVDGYRRYWNGWTRRDRAQGYAGALRQTRYHVADYCEISQPAELITCWYPFVSQGPLLAWGLPLKLLKPKQLFERIKENLLPDGSLFLVNHGPSEAKTAASLVESAGLRFRWSWTQADPLVPRPQMPVASYWQR